MNCIGGGSGGGAVGCRKGAAALINKINSKYRYLIAARWARSSKIYISDVEAGSKNVAGQKVPITFFNLGGERFILELEEEATIESVKKEIETQKGILPIEITLHDKDSDYTERGIEDGKKISDIVGDELYYTTHSKFDHFNTNYPDLINKMNITQDNIFDDIISSKVVKYLLDNNKIEALKDYLSCIKVVDLEGKNIGTVGANTIAKALEGNTTLITLDLTNNNIGAAGAMAIANALEGNTTLESFGCANNDIKDDAAKAITNAFKNSSTLKMLFISENDIQDDTAEYIAKIFNVSRRVEMFFTSENSIGNDTKDEIKKTLQTSQSKKLPSLKCYL